MANQSLLTMGGPSQEMSKFQITSSSGNYEVIVGSSIFENSISEDDLFIVDKNLTGTLKTIPRNLIELNASEDSKNLNTVEELVISMKNLNVNRKTHVVALGGGYIQDVATLACSLYMRGLKWTYVPTSLMAMVDSCIGGKSSINVGNFKNLVGNFYPPERVIADLEFTETLSASAIACGMSEAIKICYARGNSEFIEFMRLYSESSNLNSIQGGQLVAHILMAKKWFIENDEFDIGVRQLLNFGHTYGHALEAATKFAIPHGIAIGLGMQAAIDFGINRAGKQEEELVQNIRKILAPVKNEINKWSVSFDQSTFKDAFAGDKKHTSNTFRQILSIDGHLEVIEDKKSETILSQAAKSMQKVLTS